MAEECLFCRIIRGELPAEEVYRTDTVLAFRDITPIAPVHILVVPLAHHASIGEMHDPAETGQLLLAAADVARHEGVEESGYRVVLNTGRDAGQSVGHTHAHVLAGRPLGWPPG